MAEVQVSARIGLMIVQAAAARAVTPSTLAGTVGFDLTHAQDPDARIPFALEQRLWDEAARLTGDGAFGLHTAESLPLGAYGVLEYAVRSAPTFRDAVLRLARYNRIVHDAAVFQLDESPARARVEHDFRVAGLVQSRHGAEFTLATHILIGSQITATQLRPLAVEFRHARPASIDEHVRVFGVEPRFLERVNALEWPPNAMELAIPQADSALSSVLERHAEDRLAALPELTMSYADRVRQQLASQLGAGLSSLAEVAAKLKMSERSLQRRLASEGVSFDGLLDGLRHQLALRYLADPRLAVSDVAYLLGYSEPSPFHRAFRRWTGATPSEVRARGG
ncbi:MAG: AraC family transcriptional regulator [Polyangiales bacterium]